MARYVGAQCKLIYYKRPHRQLYVRLSSSLSQRPGR